MMMMMLALVAAVLARRGGAPGARVAAAAAVDVAVVAVAATRVADAAGARRELTADAAALGAVAAGRAGATPPGASAGVRPRPAAVVVVPRARAWSILSTVACGVGLEGVDESANESVEGPRGKGTIDEAGVRRGRDRVFARDGGGDGARLRHQINQIVGRRGGFATREKKGAADKKSPSSSGLTVHPARARARALVGSATSQCPAGPRRGLLLHRGPSLVHHRRRSIDLWLLLCEISGSPPRAA